MAKKFYLNDCLPQKCETGDVYSMFKDLVIAFRNLRQKEILNIDRFWTLADSPYSTKICQVPLKKLIDDNAAPSLRAYMWKLVSEGISIASMANDFEGSAQLTLDSKFNERDAHNLLLAKEVGMIAASVPAEEAIVTDKLQLTLTDKDGKVTTCEIDNLHPSNESYIESILTPPLPSSNQPLDRLKVLFGIDKVVHASEIFISKWNTLGLERQRYIVSKFEDALHADLLFPAKSDEGKDFPLMKRDDVDTMSAVHELRSKGTGVRVYFECDGSTLYIGLYNVKGKYTGDDQSKDFRRAKAIIARMRQGHDLAF